MVRVSELTEYVKEALIERNVRNDFIRVLFQPSFSLSPFHILSASATESLAYLLQSFYSYCLTQRDYTNALKLHKITCVLIMQNAKIQNEYLPLYTLLYAHEIYSKVGFWKELLIDYCINFKYEDPAFALTYRNQLANSTIAAKRKKLSQCNS